MNNSSNSTKKFLSTAIFDSISAGKSIENFCELVKSSASGEFNCLIDTGLFVNGLNNISTSADNILSNITSLKDSINIHKENVVNIENYLSGRFTNLPDLKIIVDPVVNADDGFTETDNVFLFQ